MAYLHSSFIENTQEAREWLESVGFSICACATFRNSLLLVAYAPLEISKGNAHGVGYDSAFKDEPEKEIEFYLNEAQKYGSAVDCRGNLPLFKAITALRDDSSLMQWFKSENNEWILNDENCKEDLDYGVEICVGLIYPYWHKATLEELIEHFKTKKV